jgi:hypothetical protein
MTAAGTRHLGRAGTGLAKKFGLTGQPKQYREDRTARTSQQGQDRLEHDSRSEHTGHLAQNNRDRTSRTRQSVRTAIHLAQDTWHRTSRTRHWVHDNGTEQLRQNRLDRTAGTGQTGPEQLSRVRSVGISQPGQVRSDNLAQTGQTDRTRQLLSLNTTQLSIVFLLIVFGIVSTAVNCLFTNSFWNSQQNFAQIFAKIFSKLHFGEHVYF